jgi:hypothetical protein
MEGFIGEGLQQTIGEVRYTNAHHVQYLIPKRGNLGQEPP